MKTAIFNRRSGRKLARYVLTYLLIISVTLFVGCNNRSRNTSSDVSSGTTSSSNITSTTNSGTGTETTGDSTTDTTTTGTAGGAKPTKYIDPLSGNITADSEVSKVRADAKEIKAPKNSAYLLNPLKGYAEKEAAALRESILNTGNTEEYYKITGTKYYVSPSGDDNNPGTSPDKPLRTAEKVSLLPLKAGDAVLFERGGVYRITQTIVCVEGVIYGSYGKGDKPAIYGSPQNYAADNIWKPTNKKNVWKAEFPYKQVGSIVFNHGEEVGILKVAGLDQLNANTQFYHNGDDGIVYLYCDKGNPSKVYKDIELCSEMFIFNIPIRVSNVTIDNLCLKYSGYGAVNCWYRNNNITVTNCEIGFMGGVQSSNVRLGNAIGFWEGNKGLVVEHNWVYQTFDTAISPQGFGGVGCVYENISFCNNLLEYNNADYEWFEVKGSEWRNIKCDGNIMRFTSLGWGTRLNDAGIRGIEGCIRAETTEVTFEKFTFRNNIIDCPGRDIINWMLTPEQFAGFDVGNNTVYVKASYRAVYPYNPAFLRGLHLTGTGSVIINATNQSELETIWKYWDKSPTSKVYWYD
jgi:hypothetical protein